MKFSTQSKLISSVLLSALLVGCAITGDPATDAALSVAGVATGAAVISSLNDGGSTYHYSRPYYYNGRYYSRRPYYRYNRGYYRNRYYGRPPFYRCRPGQPCPR